MINCPFARYCSLFERNLTTGRRNIKIHNFVIKRVDGLSPNEFQGIHLKDIPIVADLPTLRILLYDIDIVDGKIIGELVRWSVQKHENTVPLLRDNNHICYVSDINAFFESFRGLNCDTFFNRTRRLTSCFNPVKPTYPKKVYHIRETLFDELDFFGNKHTILR